MYKYNDDKIGLIENELEIIPLKDILNLKLAIPEYQRPYTWSVESANILFMDIYNSYKQGLEEYRLGSVILHKNDYIYNIVDGQQRMTTLAILLYCLNSEKINLLNEQYNELSENSIVNNHRLLIRKVREFIKDDYSERFKSFIEEKCTVVKIVTESEQEAFQFFDSQNSRGKELAPHDLLKSYHLREMNREEENLKIKIIAKWENQKQQELQKLFASYMFPLTQWYRGKSGLEYSSKKIGEFKGIKIDNTFNYSIYQKASNIYIEQLNKNGTAEILGTEQINQFQLTQPIIAGRRFFEYTSHYCDLHNKVQARIKDYHGEDHKGIPCRRTGDIYIKELYENALMFFADRFSFNSVSDSVMKQLYTWCYSLRLSMIAVYPESINKYALGKHEKVNYGINMFQMINDMQNPEELNIITFETIEYNENIGKKYPEIWLFLKEENGWQYEEKTCNS